MFMRFGDFASLIKQHALPSAVLKFHITRHGPANTLSILDYSLPRRKGVFHTGYNDNDWYRDSFACNCAWVEGMIPLRSNHGDFRYQDVSFQRDAAYETRPERGAEDTVKQLLRDGIITPSSQLNNFIREESRRLATNESRGYWSDNV